MSLDEEFSDRFEIMFDGYRKMIDRSFSKSSDILRFLPGVLVQKGLTMEGMAVLYKVEADFFERQIKIAFELTDDVDISDYMLEGRLSDLLQDRDCSLLYYRDHELLHIFICRQLLSLLDRFRDFDLKP